jgi:hypothetical protein
MARRRDHARRLAYRSEAAGQISPDSRLRGLTNALRRIASNLQRAGIGIVFDRETTRERDRLIHLSGVDQGKQESVASDQSATRERADTQALPLRTERTERTQKSMTFLLRTIG